MTTPASGGAGAPNRPEADARDAPIRVLVVDDQALVRSGFRIILESEPDIEVVGEAATGAEAVELATTLTPDVICMDVEMPVLNGIEASRQILSGRAQSAPSVLMLTTFGHDAYLFDALAAGVSGFLLKTSRAEQLIDAVRVVAAGGSHLGPEVTGAVLARVRGGATGGRESSGSAEAQGGGTGAGSVTGTDSAVAGAVAAGAVAAGAVADGGAASGTANGAASGAAEQAMLAAGLTPRERAVLGLLAEGRTNAEIAAELYLGEATVKTHVSNVLQKLGVRDRLQAVVWAHTRD